MGLTRAKERLFLSYAAERRLGRLRGDARARRASSSRCRPTRSCRSAAARPEPGLGRPAWPGRVSEPEPDPDPDPADEFPFRVGARVRHAGWGDGILTGLQKDGADVVVTVNFASVGRKRLLLKYAPLEEV